jgi:hypothetical protein
MHLGMSGSFGSGISGASIAGSRRVLVSSAPSSFNDPAIQFMDLLTPAPLANIPFSSRLGPEPMSAALMRRRWRSVPEQEGSLGRAARSARGQSQQHLRDEALPGGLSRCAASTNATPASAPATWPTG